MRTILFGLALLVATPVFAQSELWLRQNWKTDFSKSVVDFSEIEDVIGADGIPSIDDPKFQSAADETRVPGNEPVVALALEGTARAYPVRYLMWHEIVNDEIAGLPVAVTYCPLCNSAVVFERTLDGSPVTFGTTGKLRNSDLVMYDRDEHNWWQQFTGEAIVGARAGEKLRKLPSSMISFDMFKQRWPDGEVLLPDPIRATAAGRNPYSYYDTNPLPFLFRGELPEDIDPMMRVALVEGTAPVSVSLAHLQNNPRVRFGSYEFVWESGQASALDHPVISQGRDVGSIEVYEIGNDGSRTLAVHVVTFAFAARAFLPDLRIIQ